VVGRYIHRVALTPRGVPALFLATLLTIGSSPAAPAQAAAPVAYASFRVVRATAGEPGAPQIALPSGYKRVTGTSYQAASRAEYQAFVRGPRSAGVKVTVRWPGVRVVTVVAGNKRLALAVDPADPERVTFTLPVTAASASAAQPTLQVFSHPSGSTASGVYWRIEHNDPDRAAGHWTGVPWPAAEIRAAVNYMVATEAILQDSGLAARASRRGHFFALMGFETNNPLHLDNPPHWHLSYYPGRTFGAPKAHVPHLLMDRQGRLVHNGMDIQGQGRIRFSPGEPARIHDATGNLVVTLTIRADGGLDIDPPGGPRYSIVADDDRFDRAVRVFRGGRAWRWIAHFDAVRLGGLVTTVLGAHSPVTVYRYDRLTGVIKSVYHAP
jgi:hypothetical protein